MIIRKISITADVYSSRIHVFFVKDALKFRNKGLLKRYPLIPKSDFDKAYSLHTHDDKNYPDDYFIILNRESDWGTIAHETYHCAKEILDDHDIDHEEAIAYLIEYIIRKIQKEIAT